MMAAHNNGKGVASYRHWVLPALLLLCSLALPAGAVALAETRAHVGLLKRAPGVGQQRLEHLTNHIPPRGFEPSKWDSPDALDEHHFKIDRVDTHNVPKSQPESFWQATIGKASAKIGLAPNLAGYIHTYTGHPGVAKTEHEAFWHLESGTLITRPQPLNPKQGVKGTEPARWDDVIYLTSLKLTNLTPIGGKEAASAPAKGSSTTSASPSGSFKLQNYLSGDIDRDENPEDFATIRKALKLKKKDIEDVFNTPLLFAPDEKTTAMLFETGAGEEAYDLFTRHEKGMGRKKLVNVKVWSLNPAAEPDDLADVGLLFEDVNEDDLTVSMMFQFK